MYTVVAIPKDFKLEVAKSSFPVSPPVSLYKDKPEAERVATNLAKEHGEYKYIIFAATVGFYQQEIPVVSETFVTGY